MTDHQSSAFEVLLHATGWHGVTRIVEPPDDVKRVDRMNRAWLADDERAQRMPRVMYPDDCWPRSFWGCP